MAAIKGLSNKMTVIGLVNGMIGGIILLVPILALHSGSLLIAPITLISAFFSYFSSLLCLRHLRNYDDLDQSILKHFGNNRKYKVFYDIIIVISFFAILLLYFGLMADMWYGMIFQTKLIPILNAFALFPIVYIMKKFHLGASLLAYGIISIIGYCIFLTWMLADAPKNGENSVPLADIRFVELAAALAQGFAIQTFFIPILKQNQNPRQYKKLLFSTYAIGFLVYGFIGYAGSASIVNLLSNKEDPEQIGDYFGEKQWQVIVLEIIYVMHLYSAFPEFLLISKKRFFSIFKWPETQDVTFKEVVYVSVIIFLCLIVKLTSISPQILIELNGSIISFFFIYAIPIGLHIKCMYFTSNQERHLKFEDELQQQKQIEIVDIVKMRSSQQESEDKKSSESDLRPQKRYEQQQKKKQEEINTTEDNEKQTKYANKCQCDIIYRHKAQQICQIIIMIIMVLSGLGTMGLTLFQMISQAINSK